MIECDCTVMTDFYIEGPGFYKKRTPTARKSHRCCECRIIINPGETYTYEFGTWEGEQHSYKTCNDCIAIRKKFFSQGWTYETLWDDLREFLMMAKEVNSDCIKELPKIARDKVCDILDEANE